MKQLKYNKNSKEIEYLLEKDASLNLLFSLKDEIVVNIDDNYFLSLANIIVAQQLSSKVASVIFKRLEALFEHNITAQKILDVKDEEFRAIGLSYQKIKYLRSLSECHSQKIIDLSDLNHLSNQEIIDMLVKIKGIGVWSAQMFLMFSLGREDVFSVLDLGLRNAVKKVYNNQDLSHEEIEKMSENWIPYRSVVSHFLWHAWDTK
jgi:DNA-3-methyladenine glycosylase II